MVGFSNTVAVPNNYGPPVVDFSPLANAPQTYYNGVFNRQQQELNQQKLAAGQRQAGLATAFPNGLPRDPQTGQIDYSAVAATLAKFGDVGDAMSVLQQQPAPLNSMLSGQPTGPSPGAQQAPVAQTAARIAQVESGGNPNATNPNSTATGLGQFTNSTWLDSIKKYFPNLAQGRTDDQLLSMRKIPQLAMRVTEAFTADNEAGLSKAGLPVTPATTYLAHFAGLGGAIKVLRADPNTPVSQILGNAVVKANPFLKDMTARDLETWAARKMQAPAMAAQQAQPQGGVQVADASSSTILPPSVNAVTPRATPGTPSGDAAGAAGAPPAPSSPAGAPAPQPQQPQQQPQQPLVPQEPLPQGYNDPMKAVADLRMAAMRMSADRRPGAAQQAQALDAWAARIEQSIKPVPLRANEALVDPRTGRQIAQGQMTAGGQVGQIVRLENEERAARGEPPMSAQEEISFIQGVRPPRSAPAMAVEQFKRDFQQQNGRAPNADEITKFASDYSRQQSYGRAAGTQGARVENAANEVVQLIPQAIEASKTVPRGRWVPLNQLVQRWDQGTSDPAYNDFLMANFSLLNAYTRAMNPQGVPRIQERLEQHALGILSTAVSEQAYETQVRRLWKEVQASKTATAETARGVTPGDINSPVPGLDKPAGKDGGSSGKPSGSISIGGKSLQWSVE